MTNTSVDCIERKDKRIWRKYNPSLVKRIDVLIDTSFLNTWKNDLERENEGKVGSPMSIQRSSSSSCLQKLFYLPNP